MHLWGVDLTDYKFVLAFGIAFVISLGLTPAVFLIARRYNLASRPVADRWHTVATPHMGGIAIFIAWLVPICFLAMPSTQRDGLMVGGGLAFLLGLVDDIWPLAAIYKLGGQVVVALTVIAFGIHVEIVANPYLAAAVTVVWIVAIMNAINLIDNMDGACAGTALIIALNLAGLGLIFPSYAITSICLLLAGALTGFLVWNFPPAKIFMGDSGSMFIGFALAALSLVGSWRDASHLSIMLMIPLLLFALPLFDVALVATIRRLHGRPISQGGRDHTSHRLVLLGLSERQTLAVIWGVSLISGLLMYSVTTGTLLMKLGVGLFLIVFLLAAGLFLGRLDTYSIEKGLEDN